MTNKRLQMTPEMKALIKAFQIIDYQRDRQRPKDPEFKALRQLEVQLYNQLEVQWVPPVNTFPKMSSSMFYKSIRLKDFTKKGKEYRNWSEKNPGFALSEDGWYDHKQGQGGSLFELAKDRDLLNEARRRAGLDEGIRKQTKTKSTKTSPNTSDLAKKIWQEAKVNTDQVRKITKQYLEGQRKIPLSAYEDLVKSGWLRYHAKEKALVYPIFNPTTQLADAKKIQRVFLNETGERTERKMLGSSGKLSVIPPKTSSPSGNPDYLLSKD